MELVGCRFSSGVKLLPQLSLIKAWCGRDMNLGRVSCLLSLTHPGASRYFLGAAGWGTRMTASPPCAQLTSCSYVPQSPGGMESQAVPCSCRCLVWPRPGATGPSRSHTSGTLRCRALYLMGGEPVLKAFSSPFL